MIGTGGFLNPLDTIKQLGVKKGMIIADFGCGAGYFSIPLAKLVGGEGKVFAFDVLETALESVKGRARLEGLFNIETRRCDLEKENSSGLENDSIDLVVMANILFQSDDKNGIIKEAHRILKNEGQVIIIDWKPEQPMGPKADSIVSIESIKEIAQTLGLKFLNDLSIDKYHWGVIFSK